MGTRTMKAIRRLQGQPTHSKLKVETMSAEGLPVGGLRTVGQIMATNPLRFYAEQNGLAIAIALLSTHTADAPVVERKSTYLDFINEYDVMQVLQSGKDMNN